MIIPRFQTLQLCLHIPKTLTAVWAWNLNLKSTWSVFHQNNSQTLSSLSGFVDMHNRNSGTLSNALVFLAKHAIPPNPHASFWSQRRYFFLATKSQSTRQIFFSNGGTTCEKMHLYLRPSLVSLNLVFEDTDKWNFSFSSCCEMPQSIFEFTDWSYCLASQMVEHSVLGKCQQFALHIKRVLQQWNRKHHLQHSVGYYRSCWKLLCFSMHANTRCVKCRVQRWLELTFNKHNKPEG